MCFSLYRLTTRCLADSIMAVGKPQHTVLDSAEVTAVEEALHTVGVEASARNAVVTVYPKLIINRKLVYSKLVTRVKKRNNVTVAYTDPQMPNQVGYGCVEKFLSIQTDTNDYFHAALIRPLRVQPYTAFASLQYPSEISYLLHVCLLILSLYPTNLLL